MKNEVVAGITVGLGFLIIIAGGIWISTIRPIFRMVYLNEDMVLRSMVIIMGPPVILVTTLTVIAFCIYLWVKQENNIIGDKQ